jgi:hypothetical protein
MATDPSHLTLAQLEAMRVGARTAVRTCMGITTPDRAFILADAVSHGIGELLCEEASDAGGEVLLHDLEQCGERPMRALPEALRADLIAFRPSVTFYSASARPSEVSFRTGLRIFLLKDLNVRHGHMVGINSERYGALKEPLVVEIHDGLANRIVCSDRTLSAELAAYLDASENGRRVGEFAIGTNIGLKRLVGNLLQDEKMPGIHVAFGRPYPEETGAAWSSPVHVDLVPTRCTVAIDGEVIMTEGRFDFEVLGLPTPRG